MPWSPSVLNAREAIRGLQAGRADAVETDPIEPVPDHILQATIPHTPKPVQAMVRLQALTGMRPGDVLAMRGCDITMTGDCWEYRPNP